MNKCFFIGFLTTDVDFKFSFNGKHNSIVKFSIKLLNNSIINVIAYDKSADFCYRNLRTKDIIFIEGFLDYRMNIVADYVYLLGNSNVKKVNLIKNV